MFAIFIQYIQVLAWHNKKAWFLIKMLLKKSYIFVAKRMAW